LLISVTTFFRDAEAFEKIARDVLPGLFADRRADETIRVWVSGCATGEEAFSFAILLLEEAARHPIRPPMQVFGSDLDSRALAAAPLPLCGFRLPPRPRRPARPARGPPPPRDGGRRERRPPALFFPGRGRASPGGQGGARLLVFCRARPAQGPAVLPCRPDLVP